jgi:signal transduction histidine kinase
MEALLETPSDHGWDWPDEPRGLLPEGISELLPGAGLASVLAGIDRNELNGYELVTVIEARARLVAWAQAQLLADVAELCHTPIDYISSSAERTAAALPESADELRPALHLTRRSAENTACLALDLADRLPHVLSALEEGIIDLARAEVICDGTAHLEETEARETPTRSCARQAS